ncbi:HNH endonuclease [Variovorax sp. 22077]|uniref:HNH endonuclease n=1 Tax=Variovorax sp. 22077 TaxID=3453867 RepID=UPI003F8753E0
MRCIFCKHDSSGSQSREHILPESLGNTDHVLPKGVVCDGCNNYIARKIEKPILDSRYFQERRFQMAVQSKRGRTPLLDGVHLESQSRIQLSNSLSYGVFVGAHPDADESRWIESMRTNRRGTLILPMSAPLGDYPLSRFIGKIGLEVMAQCALEVPGGLDEIVDKPELDELRTYVRRGSAKLVWPIARRQIYPSDLDFVEGANVWQVLHEYQILLTPEKEYFIVVAIFGEEFALNLGGPDISSYSKWLAQNSDRSPLY